jgi:hypothetical protein
MEQPNGAFLAPNLQPAGASLFHVALGLLGALVLHLSLLGLMLYFSQNVEEPPDYRPPREIITAELVKKGAARPPDALPDRVGGRPKDPDAIKVRSDPDQPATAPDKKAEEDPKKRPSLSDLLKANKDAPVSTDGVGPGGEANGGDPNGSENGTANAGAVSGWGAELGAVFHKYFRRPSVISDEECARLVAKVTIKLSDDLRLADFSIKQPSGNDIFDSAIGPALTQLQDDGVRLPEPPDGSLIGRRITVVFECKERS